MSSVVVDGWFWVPRTVSDPSIRLVCFPYAGGDAPAYRALAMALPDHIEVWALRVPGSARGSTVPGPLSVGVLASDVAQALQARPHPAVALLGESFGAPVALEVARHLSGRQPPLGLIVAGSRPPHTWPSPSARPDPAMMEDVADYARRVMPGHETGWTDEHLRPILHALAEDLALLRTYRGGPEPRLGCPVLALAGDGDPDTPASDLGEWRLYSSAPLTTRIVPGLHLVVQTGGPSVADVIADHLIRWLVAASAVTT